MSEPLRIHVEDGALFESRSVEHLVGWAQKKGHDWEVVSEGAVEKFEGREAWRLAPGSHPDWMKRAPSLGVRVSRLGILDCAFRDSRGALDVELLLENALHDVIVSQGRGLDLRDNAYVIGAGGALGAGAAVALGLGYQRVHLVAEDDAPTTREIRALEKFFLGSEVRPVSAAALTLQPSSASLLINLLDLEKNPELSADLAYFNFMRRGGLVVDLTPSAGGKDLSVEAEQAGLRVLPAFEVTAEYEMLFARRLGLDLEPDRKDFLASWFELSGTRKS